MERDSRDPGIVSFYFTNFPTSNDIEVLWGMFLKWGKVVDVYVPRKKNKDGKAFGFVRFKEVLYPYELERRLDQIWIGSYKLRANCSRFHRQKEDKAMQVEKQYRKPVAGLQNSQKTQWSKSFADVVKGKQCNKE